MHSFKYIKSASELGTNLKTAREKADLTQSEVGKIIGVERSAISCYETARTVPSVFTIIKLAEIYNTDIKNLIIVN